MWITCTEHYVIEYLQICSYISVMKVYLTWDEAKNRSNQEKHDGIAFEEAAHVFRDPFRLTRQDRVEGHEER